MLLLSCKKSISPSTTAGANPGTESGPENFLATQKFQWSERGECWHPSVGMLFNKLQLNSREMPFSCGFVWILVCLHVFVSYLALTVSPEQCGKWDEGFLPSWYPQSLKVLQIPLLQLIWLHFNVPLSRINFQTGITQYRIKYYRRCY